MTDFDLTESKTTSENQRAKWAEQKRQQRARLAAKPLERFPSKFFEIMGYFEHAQELARDIVLAVDNEKQAQSIKFTWYEFKKALKSPHRQNTHNGWDTLCERVLLRVRDNTLTWSWRDLDKMYEALNKLEIDFSITASPANTLTIPSSMIPPAADTESIYEAFAGKKPDPSQSPSDSTAGLTVEELMKREMGIEE